MKRTITFAAFAAALALAGSVRAQTAATLSTLGTTAPTPGNNDVSQMSATGNAGDGLNYYDDNGANHDGWMGQTFTTGSSTTGYILSSLAIGMGGSGSTSGTDTAQDYFLRIYSVSTNATSAVATATLVSTYTATGFTFTSGDWLLWTGLNDTLKPNATYAYTFGRAATGSGWEALATDDSNPYAGGEICSIPAAGGAITFGTTSGAHASDGVFDLGLTPANLPVSSPIAVSPGTTVYAGTSVTLTEVAKGSAPLSYKWLSDGGSGGALTAIPSVSGTNYSFTAVAGTYQYQVTVSNPSGTSTTPVSTLIVKPASAPIISTNGDTAAAPDKTLTVGRTVTFSAALEGTLPIAYQWQVDKGNGFVAVSASATNTSLSLTNIQASDAGLYRLAGSNSVGQGNSTALQLTVTDSAHPSVANASFENPVKDSGGWSTDVAPGWNGTAFGVQHFTTNEFNTADPLPAPGAGNQACYLGNTSTIYQDVGPLLANAQYTLTVAVGTRTDQAAVQGVILQLVNGSDATGTLLAQTTFTNSSQSVFEDATLVAPTIGATPTGDLTIVIKGITANQVEVDNVRLTVNTGATPNAPTIFAQPESKILYTNRTAVFSATVFGTSPNLQWQKAGANLSNGGNISGANTSTLTVANVTSADAGTYTLVASNAKGTVTTTPVTLGVVDTTSDYEKAVLTANPLAFWRLNEKSNPSADGVAAADFASGFNGIYGVDAQNGFNSIAGVLPKDGFSFFEASNTGLATAAADVTSVVTVPALNLNTNTVTFTAWLHPNGAQANWTGILMTRQTTQAGIGYNDQSMLAYTWNNNKTWSFVSGLVIPQDQWSFVAVSIAPDQAAFYVYYKDATGKDTHLTTNNVIVHSNEVWEGPASIGCDGTGTDRVFLGTIDEVAVFNHTLAADQIMNLYKGVAQVVAQPSKLSVSAVSGGKVTVSWDKSGKLQSTSVLGSQATWTDEGTTNPVTVNVTGSAKFFRVLAQ